MAVIYVKAKEGRKAFYEGRIIPSDKFVAVTDDPYISRLVHHWGDLEVQGGDEQAVGRPTTKMKPVEKGPTPPVPGGGRERLQPALPPAPATGAPRPSPPQAKND